MDLIYEYREQLWSGTLLTIRLALASLAISVTFGLLGAWAKLSGHRLARRAMPIPPWCAACRIWC